MDGSLGWCFREWSMVLFLTVGLGWRVVEKRREDWKGGAVGGGSGIFLLWIDRMICG